MISRGEYGRPQGATPKPKRAAKPCTAPRRISTSSRRTSSADEVAGRDPPPSRRPVDWRQALGLLTDRCVVCIDRGGLHGVERRCPLGCWERGVASCRVSLMPEGTPPPAEVQPAKIHFSALDPPPRWMYLASFSNCRPCGWNGFASKGGKRA